jgi:hypothetical protein
MTSFCEAAASLVNATFVQKIANGLSLLRRECYTSNVLGPALCAPNSPGSPQLGNYFFSFFFLDTSSPGT